MSTKHQIAVPSEARHRLGIRAGDRLDVEIGDDTIILRKRSAHVSDRLRGLGAEMWRGVDPVEYVRELRREWDDRAPR